MPETRCVGVNIKYKKNTFLILTNISIVLHNLLQCVSFFFFSSTAHKTVSSGKFVKERSFFRKSLISFM